MFQSINKRAKIFIAGVKSRIISKVTHFCIFIFQSVWDWLLAVFRKEFQSQIQNVDSLFHWSFGNTNLGQYPNSHMLTLYHDEKKSNKFHYFIKNYFDIRFFSIKVKLKDWFLTMSKNAVSKDDYMVNWASPWFSNRYAGTD